MIRVHFGIARHPFALDSVALLPQQAELLETLRVHPARPCALRHGVYGHSKDLRLTQRFARHRGVATTTIFTHPSDEDLVRAVEQLRC